MFTWTFYLELKDTEAETRSPLSSNL